MFRKILFYLLLCFSCTAFAKNLALSFDDGLNPNTDSQAKYINKAILDSLERNHIKAILYPSISKIGGADGLSLVEQWGKQGHRIGNHGNLHLNLNRDDVLLSQYLDDMQQGHQAFSTLKGFVPRYRFPFLKEGNTLEKRDVVRQWIKQHKYHSGAVSIDASDWYYNQLFLKYQKENDQLSLVKLKQAYIFHLLDRAQYYDDLAINILGRSPKHVLVLHVRAINAAWLQEIIDAFHQHGWTFIDSNTAYQDPIYNIEPKILPAGESIIWNIAKASGIPDLRYPAEDAQYEYPTLKHYGLNVTPIP